MAARSNVDKKVFSGGGRLKYRLLTINREFGSGGSRIAEAIATKLGWKLLDKEIIDAIAYAAHVDSDLVLRYDERVESWLKRFNQQAMRSAALAAGLELRDDSVFDAEEMFRITKKVIEEAYEEGNCIIVGRGAQCILQNRPDVYHVFVHAPAKIRLERLCDYLAPDANVEQRMRQADSARAKYMQQYFGKVWMDMRLYNMTISTEDGEPEAARTIVYAMSGAPDFLGKL
jgi:cytidylate kinase